MTDEQKALLREIGASLKHVGNGLAESFNHAGMGSKTPLQPLDVALAKEIPNLQRHGQQHLVDGLASLRIELGD